MKKIIAITLLLSAVTTFASEKLDLPNLSRYFTPLSLGYVEEVVSVLEDEENAQDKDLYEILTRIEKHFDNGEGIYSYKMSYLKKDEILGEEGLVDSLDSTFNNLIDSKNITAQELLIKEVRKGVDYYNGERKKNHRDSFSVSYGGYNEKLRSKLLELLMSDDSLRRDIQKMPDSLVYSFTRLGQFETLFTIIDGDFEKYKERVGKSVLPSGHPKNIFSVLSMKESWSYRLPSTPSRYKLNHDGKCSSYTKRCLFNPYVMMISKGNRTEFAKHILSYRYNWEGLDQIAHLDLLASAITFSNTEFVEDIFHLAYRSKNFFPILPEVKSTWSVNPRPKVFPVFMAYFEANKDSWTDEDLLRIQENIKVLFNYFDDYILQDESFRRLVKSTNIFNDFDNDYPLK